MTARTHAPAFHKILFFFFFFFFFFFPTFFFFFLFSFSFPFFFVGTMQAGPGCHLCPETDGAAATKMCPCGTVRYCSREHQVADWRRHRATCSAARSRTEATKAKNGGMEHPDSAAAADGDMAELVDALGSMTAH
jgi:hypothetical protein